MLDPQKQLDRVIRLLTELQAARFYGTIDIDMRDGTIHRVVKHESIKLEHPKP